MMPSRITRRLAAPATVAMIALVGLAGPAAAHVTVSADTTAAGAYSVLTVSVPHGCEGSATTKVAIQIPKEILSVKPTRNSFWDVEVTKEKLAKATKDAHGNEVTERDATVTYTAKTPLPDDQRDTFELSLQLPDASGTTLTFPTVQTCEEGETGWTEVPASGQDAEELEHPAPAVTITAADDDMADHATDQGDDADESSAGATDDSTKLWSQLGLGAGVIGLIAGLAALVRTRRQA